MFTPDRYIDVGNFIEATTPFVKQRYRTATYTKLITVIKEVCDDKELSYSLQNAVTLSEQALSQHHDFGLACLALWRTVLGLHNLHPGMSSYAVKVHFDELEDNFPKLTNDDPPAITTDSAIEYLTSLGYCVTLSKEAPVI